MATTTEIRTWWAPACTPIGPVLIEAYRALDACFEAHRYKLRQADTGAYNCRKITGGTGYSLHAYGPGHKFTFYCGVTVTTALAVDVNWQSNPYGPTLITDMPPAMIAAIKAIRTRNGKQVWRWGGDYTGSNKDAMHFEVVAHPSDLATGIDPSTLPRTTPVPPASKPTAKDIDMLIITCAGKPTRLLTGFTCSVIDGATVTNLTAAGIKTVKFEADDYDRLLKHVGDSLD